MASAQEIVDWSKSIGLAECVGAEFAAEHNGKLPGSIGELDNWGNGTGRRHPDGTWACKGTTPPGNVPGSVTGAPGVGSPSASPSGTFGLNQAIGWATANPIVAALLAYVVVRSISRR